MNYYAIDVETANQNYYSICQIGIAEFNNGEVVDTWTTLVNPQSEFNPVNTSIHGITESDVANAPSFYDIYEELDSRLSGKITVHHGPFDRTAINQGCDQCNLDYIQAKWLDSCRVARRTWEEIAYDGYGLSSVARMLEINFRHHDALEDAITAGIIVREACVNTGLSIEDWFSKADRPIRSKKRAVDLTPNPKGHLYGQCIVFTGDLPSISRRRAKEMAAGAGCTIKKSVSKKVSLLVVGVQDPSKLAGFEKSGKHRKAEELIRKGHNIKILDEQMFVDLCARKTTIN